MDDQEDRSQAIYDRQLAAQHMLVAANRAVGFAATHWTRLTADDRFAICEAVELALRAARLVGG